MPNLLNGQFWPFHVKAASAKFLAWLLRNILNKNLYNLALLLCMALTVPLNTCVKSRAFHAATLQRCLAASLLCVINRWCCVSQVINKSVITITFFTKTENVKLFTFKLSYCIISYSLNSIYCILCDILRNYSRPVARNFYGGGGGAIFLKREIFLKKFSEKFSENSFFFLKKNVINF